MSTPDTSPKPKRTNFNPLQQNFNKFLDTEIITERNFNQL